MKCPFCGYEESKVIDSRHSEDGASIRRRRECLSCQKRFTTYETVETLPLIVIKKDGSRQSFDRDKVTRSMVRACEKRRVTMAEMEAAALEIEPLDEVAYIRFASVYRQFKDINTFMNELKKILAEK